MEYRFAEGRLDRLPALVDELLRLQVDVLYAASPQALRAARHATRTVPIVAVDLETDPVHAGWVKNLAQPDGNLTGFFLDIPELSGKQVQFLTEALPTSNGSLCCGMLRSPRLSSRQPRLLKESAGRLRFLDESEQVALLEAAAEPVHDRPGRHPHRPPDQV